MAEQNPEGPTEVLARQLRTWRGERNLSAQGLAERIAELGGNLSRVAISKIENGDRGVSLDEWLQLAHALAVPPPLLFLDLERGTPVRIAPAVELHPWLAWEWVVGDEPPIMSNRSVARVEEFGRAQTAIHLYREEVAALSAVDSAVRALRAAEYAEDADAVRTARSGHVEALQRLANVLDEMMEHGMALPALSASRLDPIRSLGLSRYPDALVLFDPKAADGER